MRYDTYGAALKECIARPKRMYRIDVVLFNLEPQEDGTNKSVEGEYYERNGDCHPFECIFDDRDEAVAYIKTFTQEMAQDALRTSTNVLKYDHVAVEVNELDESLDPGYVIACCDWLYGTQLDCWVNEECVGRIEDVRAD